MEPFVRSNGSSYITKQRVPESESTVCRLTDIPFEKRHRLRRNAPDGTHLTVVFDSMDPAKIQAGHGVKSFGRRERPYFERPLGHPGLPHPSWKWTISDEYGSMQGRINARLGYSSATICAHRAEKPGYIGGSACPLLDCNLLA